MSSPAQEPARGGPWPAWPATYERGPQVQAAFERAVATLWAADSWLNPRTGQRELNADLVLEGGGVKGIGLAGAILVLAEAGYRFPRAAGTSAGAIAAVLVAAIEKSGKDMTALSDYLSQIDYRRFTQTGPVRRAFRRLGGRLAEAGQLLFSPGLYSGGYLTDWLGGKLAECGVATWGDLALTAADDAQMCLPPERRYRAVVHASDLTRAMLARLPWDYGPFYGLPPDDQPVVDSVRASMSIPFFFTPVRTAVGPARTAMPDGSFLNWPGGTVTWTDGGMLMNFPIGAFDRTDGIAPRWPTIGIKLSPQPGPQPPDTAVTSTLAEGYRCLLTMMSEWDRYQVEAATATRTIFIPNGGVAATDFDLTAAQQHTLFRNGAQAATEFLIKWAGNGVPRSGEGGLARATELASRRAGG